MRCTRNLTKTKTTRACSPNGAAPRWSPAAGHADQLPQYEAGEYKRDEKRQQACFNGRFGLQPEEVPEVYLPETKKQCPGYAPSGRDNPAFSKPVPQVADHFI